MSPPSFVASMNRLDIMFSKLARSIVQGAGYLAGVATVLILILVCVEVIVRLFGSSTMIADEFAGYLNAAIIFLGLVMPCAKVLLSVSKFFMTNSKGSCAALLSGSSS